MISTYITHLTAKKNLTQNTYLFEFALNQGKLEFEAGQYLVLFVPQQNNEYARRLYSIATPPDQSDHFELLVELVPFGVASSYFERLNVQDQVMFQGPAGVFSIRQNTKEKLFLITGTGIAPIRSMLNHNLSQSKQKFTLFWGLRYATDSYFFQEFKTLAQKYPQFQFKICLSREPNLDQIPDSDRHYFSLGHVNDVYDEFIGNRSASRRIEIGNFDYYLCGGRDIIESLRQHLLAKGIPKENIVSEKF